jgi:hypothetical protein
MKKKEYIVTITSSYVVEAETEDEAIERATEMDIDMPNREITVEKA